LDFYGFRFVSFGLAGNVVKCTLLAEHVSGRRSSASGSRGEEDLVGSLRDGVPQKLTTLFRLKVIFLRKIR